MLKVWAYIAMAAALAASVPLTARAQSPDEDPTRAQVPELAPAQTHVQSDSDPRPWPAWLPWATAGGGLAILAVGGGLYRAASNNYDEYDAQIEAQCGLAGCIGDELADLTPQLDRARTQETVSKVAFVVGGAAIATGAVLYFLDRRASSESATIDRITVIPSLGPGVAGVTTSIAF